MDKYTLLLTLKNINGIGNIVAKRIMDNLRDTEINIEKLFIILQDLPRVKIKDIKKLEEAYSKAKTIINKMDNGDMKMITYFDDNYPKNFLSLRDLPVILFYLGDINLVNKKCVAVVGTRNPSKIGRKASYNISKKLCRDYVIVSGLAEGIDSEAHKAAVESNGKTIAILGNGLDIIFPPQNKQLFESIIKKGGLIISEYPPGQTYLKYTFVARDRLQSALSEKVFIIETEKDGGTMYTAEKALEYKKELLVFKSNVTDYLLPSGNLLLIQNGAKIFDEEY